MPIRYEIDKDLDIVFEVGSGTATTREFRQLIESLISDEDFAPGMDAICDFRELSFNIVTEDIEELYELMERQADAFGDSRFAVVASKDLEFGIVRMFSMISDDARFKTRVFRDIDEARRWLGLPATSTVK